MIKKIYGQHIFYFSVLTIVLSIVTLITGSSVEFSSQLTIPFVCLFLILSVGISHGAMDNYKNFSKRQVIDRILKKNQVSGEQLLIFGDGYVEIEDCKNVGGLAVAVASDEANNGSGEFDEWKRNRLLGVGADIVIPDYRDAELLLNVIEGK